MNQKMTTQTAGTETVAETKTPEVADDANLTATQQIIKQIGRAHV